MDISKMLLNHKMKKAKDLLIIKRVIYRKYGPVNLKFILKIQGPQICNKYSPAKSTSVNHKKI